MVCRILKQFYEGRQGHKKKFYERDKGQEALINKQKRAAWAKKLVHREYT